MKGVPVYNNSHKGVETSSITTILYLLNIFLCFFELQNNQFLKLMNYDY